jgi:molybdenum cofactor cytidylyltransferase
MIWAMILAAGESKRMGKPKLLLSFGEKTIIEAVISNVVQSKAENILVVLGSDREKVEEKIRGLPVKVVFNPNFRKGMLSSAQLGFQTLPEDTQAVLVFLGDQPAVSHTVIDTVIDAYNRTKKGIVLPVYEGNRGHPVLIDMKYKDEIKKLSADVGLRGVVYSHPEDIEEVGVETPSVLQDIDDAEDYDRELELKKEG